MKFIFKASESHSKELSEEWAESGITNRTMKAQAFYEQARKTGLTNDITGNPDPNYNESFYRAIFALMEDYAKSENENIRDFIRLNKAEVQSGHHRVAWAEKL